MPRALWKLQVVFAAIFSAAGAPVNRMRKYTHTYTERERGRPFRLTGRVSGFRDLGVLGLRGLGGLGG